MDERCKSMDGGVRAMFEAVNGCQLSRAKVSRTPLLKLYEAVKARCVHRGEGRSRSSPGQVEGRAVLRATDRLALIPQGPVDRRPFHLEEPLLASNAELRAKVKAWGAFLPSLLLRWTGGALLSVVSSSFSWLDLPPTLNCILNLSLLLSL